jgi:two-component system chemotaxis sensor kinase CheA
MDLEKYLSLFFAEARENLETMEQGLLKLEAGATGEDLLNQVFRAAHTLKGNSASFRFSGTVRIAHEMESFLDRVRVGEAKFSADRFSLLLRALDALKAHLVRAETSGKEPALTSEMEEIVQRLVSREKSSPNQDSRPSGGWRISFAPNPEMMARGNDVVLMFRALEELGSLKVKADVSRLPEFRKLDPEKIYLSWQLELRGNIPEDLVREVFEWVEDECDLSISSLETDELEREEEDEVLLPPPPTSQAAESLDVRFMKVDTQKAEQLLNMVGELVITQSMLDRLGEELAHESLSEALQQLSRNTRELQESVLRIRMVSIGVAFQRLQRQVRDLALGLGKKVTLNLQGADTELDKGVLERVLDPLIHLVRNCVDHGIENPDRREALGKPETGTIFVSAYQQGGSVFLEVGDDGAGLDRTKLVEKGRALGLDLTPEDPELYNLIFRPGLSTAEEVSEVSGRGVGMDIVRRNVVGLGGSIEVFSEKGVGTKFVLKLPLTLTILSGQLVRTGREIVVLPFFSIVECLQLEEELVRLMGGTRLYFYREQYIPMVDLRVPLGFEDEHAPSGRMLAIVLEWGGHRVAFLADELLDQQQVVVKSLETNFYRVEGVLGATILGDGKVALILDAAALIQMVLKPRKVEHS